MNWVAYMYLMSEKVTGVSLPTLPLSWLRTYFYMAVGDPLYEITPRKGDTKKMFTIRRTGEDCSTAIIGLIDLNLARLEEVNSEIRVLLVLPGDAAQEEAK